MPVYEYFIPELDQRVALLRPVERRDDPLEVKRVTVPDRIAIAGSAQDPHSFDNQYARGLRRLEQRGELPRDFTTEQLKGVMRHARTA
jgi:hypothetical protein